MALVLVLTILPFEVLKASAAMMFEDYEAATVYTAPQDDGITVVGNSYDKIKTDIPINDTTAKYTTDDNKDFKGIRSNAIGGISDLNMFIDRINHYTREGWELEFYATGDFGHGSRDSHFAILRESSGNRNFKGIRSNAIGGISDLNMFIDRINRNTREGWELKFYTTGEAGHATRDSHFAIFLKGQEASALSLNIDSWSPGASAQSRLVTVSSNAVWAASINVPWIYVTPRYGTNYGDFTISVTANTGTAARSGVVTVAGGGITRTITVTQAGGRNADPKHQPDTQHHDDIPSTECRLYPTCGDKHRY